MSTEHADTILKIDLKALAANYQLLSKKSGQAKCAAVVKANAYGLGVASVSRALHKAGAEIFFVATLDEAIALRYLYKQCTIYVFHGVGVGQEKIFLEHDLIPVLISMDQVSRWNGLARKQQRKLSAILHVDTGMNRLGLSMKEAQVLAQDKSLLNMFDVQYLMSHLACADEPLHPLNQEQLAAVKQLTVLFPGIPVSLANSFGIFLGKEYHFDLLRPGCALYGINPVPGKKNPMQSVVSLTSRIIQIREIDTLQSVGYGATQSLPKGAKVATVPVGYADGYLRSSGGKGFCVMQNRKVPIVGRVSMDLIVLDVSAVSGLAVGDSVEIIGKTISVDEVAEYAGTIGYEVLTRLGSRYKSVYQE